MDEGREGGGVEGEEVESVDNCAGGGVVAGEEEEFHLGEGELFEFGVHGWGCDVLRF